MGHLWNGVLMLGLTLLTLGCQDDIPVGCDNPLSAMCPEYSLSVTIASGSGSGRVTSTPSGIDCSLGEGALMGTCSADFREDTEVALVAIAGAVTVFDGWSGGCLGTSESCLVRVVSDTAVVAHLPQRAVVGVVGSATVTVSTAEGTSPPDEFKQISNLGVAGDRSLEYTVESTVPWLQAQPTSGTLDPGESQILQFIFSTEGRAAGLHTGMVQILDPDAFNTPRTITVDLTVN